MFVDTHLHLSEKEGICPSEFIENAKVAGVSTLILSCCDRESIEEGVELAERYDNLYLSIGFHPEVVSFVDDSDLDWLESVVKSCSKVVAIGEVGLDYHWEKDKKEQQIILFRKQLDLASCLNLPVVIHTRDAIQETYDILSEYSLTGSIHCFSGSVEMAEKFVKLGYFLGIGGVITFSNSKLYQVVEKIGLSSILLETDSPYLAPSPYRGKVNQSAYIPIIAKKLAEILDVDVEEIAEVTTRNAKDLFRIL